MPVLTKHNLQMEKFKVRFSHQDIEVEVAQSDLLKVINQLRGDRRASLETESSSVSISNPQSVAIAKSDVSTASIAEKKRPGRKAGTKLVKIDGKSVLVDPSSERIPPMEAAVESLPIEKKKGAVGRKKIVKPDLATTDEVLDAPKKRGRAKKVAEVAPSEEVIAPESEIKEKPTPVSNIVEWEHDAGRYGMPLPSWGKTDIALWFLYVAKANTGESSFSRSQIAESINKNFKPERRLREETLLKELSAYKRGKKIYVREVAPDRYTLTEEGERYVESLIAQSIESM